MDIFNFMGWQGAPEHTTSVFFIPGSKPLLHEGERSSFSLDLWGPHPSEDPAPELGHLPAWKTADFPETTQNNAHFQSSLNIFIHVDILNTWYMGNLKPVSFRHFYIFFLSLFRSVWLSATGWISYHSDTIASHTAGNNECWMLTGSIQSNDRHL